MDRLHDLGICVRHPPENLLLDHFFDLRITDDVAFVVTLQHDTNLFFRNVVLREIFKLPNDVPHS